MKIEQTESMTDAEIDSIEWIDIRPYEGHPIRLSRNELLDWINADGDCGIKEYNGENGCYGKAFYQ